MENAYIEEPMSYEEARDAAEREEAVARENAREVVLDGRKAARERWRRSSAKGHDVVSR